MNEKKTELDPPDELNETHQFTPGFKPTSLATSPTRPGPFGAAVNYQLVKIHAHGGLGRVWSAVDLRLNREIAIKELLPKRVNDASARRRFLLEAQVTGQLTHPHIVPIYQLGDNAETGAPYYAMRFIHGDTLRAAVATARQSPTGMTDIERRRLLAAFVSVCNAIAYANARGVVHRDLKPENIVLGEYGEVLVIDWGLAKVAGREDEPMASVEVSSEISASATMQGSVLGTPVYMAPEQAAGKIDEIDARTDVFGLGAILFEILTGEPPHERGRPVMDMIQLIATSPCRHPRDLDKQVPAALNAICVKATMLAPANRYPTATDLAHDIELWLAGEPVAAFREPWQAQAWRWARRHRTLVTTTAVLLVTSVLGLSLNTWMVGKEQQRTNVALRRAQKNLNSARRAVDEMLTGIADKKLENEPRMEGLRSELFGKAQSFYETLTKDSPDDPDLKIDVAEAQEKVGDIASLLGNTTQARGAYRRSIQSLENLREDESLENTTAYRLAHVHDSLGEVLRKDGDLTEAEGEYRSAIQILQTNDPGPTDKHGELARIENNLGLMLYDSDRADEAEVLFNDSIDGYNQLLRHDPERRDFRQGLARTFINLGMLKRNSNQVSECEAAYGKAIAILRALLAEHADAQEYRYELGAALLNLGNARLASDDPTRKLEAELPYRDSLTQLESLVSDFPSTPLYLKDLASATNGLGGLLFRANKLDEAEKVWRSAIVSFEKLMTIQSDLPEHESQVAMLKNNLARLLKGRQKYAEALTLLESAKAFCQAAIDATPKHQQRRENLVTICRSLADVYVKSKMHREGYETAMEVTSLEGATAVDFVVEAQVIANSIKLLNDDLQIPPDERASEAKRRTNDLISIIDQAISNGFNKRDMLDNMIFDDIRADERFQELLVKLAKSKD